MNRAARTFISSKYVSMLWSGTLLMVLTALVGTVDTLIAGLTLGQDAVAGICLVLPVYSLAGFFAGCFSFGVPILYAELTGAFRKEEADRCFGVGLTLNILIGLLMFLAIRVFGDAFLRSYHVGGQVYESAREYLSFIKYAVLMLPLNELLDAMVFTDGDEKTSLTADLVQGLLKLLLSVALCRSMGAKGLALATFLSFTLPLLIFCLHFFRPGNTIKPNLSFSPSVLWQIVKYGIVDASSYLVVSVFTVGLTFFVTRYFGADMLILVSVITLIKEAQTVFEGIGEAITPILGIYLGEENTPGVHEVWKYAQWTVWAEGLFFTVLLLACARLIVRILDIQDPAVVTFAVRGLWLLSLTQVFTCRMYLDPAYFILIEKIPLGVLDTVLRDLLPALPMAVLGGMLGGVYGMFIALTASAPLGYYLSVLYITHRYGRENYPLFLAGKEKKNVRLYEFCLSPEAVTEVRDRLGAALREASCPESRSNAAMVLFEELFMLIFESNPQKTVLAECMVEIGDTVRMITKDDGRIVDLTDTDRDVSSLRSYALSNLLEARTTQRVHFLALSYNRNVLEIR